MYYNIFSDAFTREGKVLSVCGEMGGDPYSAAVLIGLGIRKLSMSYSSVASVKKLISTLEIAQSETIAKTVMQKEQADEVYAFLKETLGSGY